MKRRLSVPIRFNDIDAMGHVNNAVFLTYFEEARILFFQEHVGKDWDWQKHGIILARNEVDYLHPVLHRDSMEIDVIIKDVGTKSIRVEYEVWTKDTRLCAKGASVLVTYDHTIGRTVPVPETWREVLLP